MNVLFDTNILLSIIRASDFAGIVQFLNPENSPAYISIVSEGEIKSLALQNNWGVSRRRLLDNLLDQINIIDISKLSIKVYAEIEAFSQKRNPGFPAYPFASPRNMGKNDLWIASLAALLGLTLITTDSDFDHLHNVFFEVRKIEPTSFNIFF